MYLVVILVLQRHECFSSMLYFYKFMNERCIQELLTFMKRGSRALVYMNFVLLQQYDNLWRALEL